MTDSDTTLVDEARPVIWVRGEFEWFVSPDECDDDQQAAMDLVRERIGEAGGRVLTREETTHWPPANLPPTPSTIDAVRRVCDAAGLGDLVRVSDGVSVCFGATATVRVEARPGGRLQIHVDRSPDERVATFYPDSPTPLLWSAIQSARSGR